MSSNTVSNNAIFNYDTQKYEGTKPHFSTGSALRYSYPIKTFGPSMKPLNRNETDNRHLIKYCQYDTIDWHPEEAVMKRNKRHFYEICFPTPEMWKKEIQNSGAVVPLSALGPIRDRKIIIRDKYFNCNGLTFRENSQIHYGSEINPYHFVKSYKELKAMMKLKWKDINFTGIIMTKYKTLIDWTDEMKIRYNGTSQRDIFSVKLGIHRKDTERKVINSASFGHGKHNWLRVYCEEFIRAFQNMYIILWKVVFHFEKTKRMQVASAKICAWFLRMKYNPKSPYAQKWLWEDFQDICEDEDDRRYNPFYEKHINLRQMLACA